MKPRTRTVGLALAAILLASPALAQDAPPPQDPSLDNLVHATGYKTAEPGTLGAVVERGKGKLDVVIRSFFEQPWKGVIEGVPLDGAGIMVMDDKGGALETYPGAVRASCA